MQVIFNGDDFGLTQGINQGVIRSFKQGLLSGASLVPGGEAGQEAISLAQNNPDLDIGVHLVLSDEPSILQSNSLSSIVRSSCKFPTRNHLLRSIITGRIDFSQVEAEWHAQIERVLSAGIPVSHLNSHQFVHLFPGLWQVCLKMAQKYNIPFVRGSSDDSVSSGVGWVRLMQWTGLSLWTHWVVSRWVPSHIRVVPSVGFLRAGGRWTLDTLLNALEAIRFKKTPGAVEVMLHPGIGDAHTRTKYRHWEYDWKKDMDLLMDPFLRARLPLRHMTPTSFRQAL